HLRRRDSALDPPAPAGVWRRHRVHQGVRPGRGERPVRTPARRGCAGAALLHHEPERRDERHRAPAGPGMSLKPALTVLLAGVLWLGGCATRAPSVPPTAEAPDAAQGERGDSWREIERGLASWYG